jgi:SAM-dependent methyltransferase
MPFAGDAADHYARFRRGYSGAALEFVLDRLGVGSDDLVVDLGCGTGQLALPLAVRVRHLLGIDPRAGHARPCVEVHDGDAQPVGGQAARDRRPDAPCSPR